MTAEYVDEFLTKLHVVPLEDGVMLGTGNNLFFHLRNKDDLRDVLYTIQEAIKKHNYLESRHKPNKGK